MLIRGVLRLMAFVGPIVTVLILFSVLYNEVHLFKPSQPGNRVGNGSSTLAGLTSVAVSHTEVFSASTRNGKYFSIEFGKEEAINPSIIPHPTTKDTWIIVAQHRNPSAESHSPWFTELVCDAMFKKGRLACIKAPSILPIAATPGDNCDGDLAYFGLNIGPHDARVFYGPRTAYTIYGSNSAFTCFGQWVQDFTMLVDWGPKAPPKNEFRFATELQRPAPFSAVEKNWFFFWDRRGEVYVHYDVAPRRSFAKLEKDGSVGPDLAPLAVATDEKCMAALMPEAALTFESVHQATNSLSITMCNRSDISCEPNDTNTYIMTIFQHKSFYSYHSVYEPYVMLLRNSEPFWVHGISSKPIWIHGRLKSGEAKRPAGREFQGLKSWDQTEMVYVTSMSWKAHGQKYHGYLDDVLFIGFGIEDERSGGIDVVAGDLLRDVRLCSSV